MATPVFKFKDKISEQDYYFIYDTFHELPKTIPMCLSTFVYYHLESHRTLEGFIATFHDIEKNGSSLYDSSFDAFFNEEEKSFYINQLTDCYTANELDKLSKESLLIKDFILKGMYENKSLTKFIHTNLKETINEFRSTNYYDSLSSTLPKFPYQYENNNGSLDSPGNTPDDDLPF